MPPSIAQHSVYLRRELALKDYARVTGFALSDKEMLDQLKIVS